MRSTVRTWFFLMAMVAAAACGSNNGLDDGGADTRTDAVTMDSRDVGATDVPPADAPATDVPASDVPVTDVPAMDAPRDDVPMTDGPAMDVPAVDVPRIDTPVVDVPASDTPTVDAGGCRSAADCPRGGVCNLTTCGSVGMCQPPLPCTTIIDPVCGCDGMTYTNDCIRRNASVGLAHRGACSTGTDAGGCSVSTGCCANDGDCRGGAYCVAEGPALCVSGRAVGVCKSAPTTAGHCWRDSDCRIATMRCVGARICACGLACLLPDAEGTCR